MHGNDRAPTRRNPGRLAAVGAAIAVGLAGLVAAAPAVAADGGVEVTTIRVDGRAGDLLGTGSAAPRLSWEFTATGRTAACQADPDRPCPADEQTAYQVRAASSAGALARGLWLWDSGKVAGDDNVDVAWGGPELSSRDAVHWQVRVWDALGNASEWSDPSVFEVGLLEQSDWEPARWIENHAREESDPLPIFARSFDVDQEVVEARLYLSGVGQHLATVNGQEITDEVLAPGYSNYQLSSEYRVYDVADVLADGENVVGVELGHGPAYVRRNLINEDVGRLRPYAWWQSTYKGRGTLLADVEPGATTVLLDSVEGYHVGGTVNVDTGDGGERLESRVITAIGTAGPDGTGITFTPGLSAAHAAGSVVTGSGDNVADIDPAAGAAVSPRFIGRLELEYADGTRDTIVTDRSWLTATGPLVTDAWYSGADVDDRRVQVGWNEPGADHGDTAVRRDGSPMDWGPAGIAPPPNLATQLVARTAEVVKVVHEWEPVEITNPREGTWVFDFGQNMAGIPELRLTDPLPAGTTIRLTPAESLNADGTVNQASFGVGNRGTDVFNTYTTSGRPDETWRADFNYFSMQWIQVDGLPADFTPDESTVRALQVMADVERPGSLVTSDERVNRVERMSRYSVLSNVQSVITDTPGREKLSYPADYTQPIGFIHRQVDLRAFLHTTMRHLVESQSVDDTDMRGNIPLKAPVYDWGYTRQFGDEINWGNAIILVPWLHYELYGDTSLMEEFYPQMNLFVEYIQREKVGTGEDEHIVDAALGDWVSAQQTSGEITGTWGYHYMIDRMARMAELIGDDEHAERYGALAEEIRDAFNERFYDEELGRYTFVSEGQVVATQAAQALALESGIVEEENRESVEDALAELVREYSPEGGGPHFSAGTIGMQPVVRSLMAAGEDELLWEVLQQDTYPSLGYFMAPTVENPDGMTTVGERWTRRDSKNHMILAQVDEWFHAGLAGIRQAPGSAGYREVVVEPTMVGDLTFVEGSYRSPQGEIRSSWELEGDSFRLDVVVPGNTRAEVRVPLDVVDGDPVATFGAEPDAVEDGHAVYHVGSGWWTFGVGIDLSASGSLTTLDDALAGYVAAGDVAGPVAGQLVNALEQAQRHLDAGRETPAARALERFVRHLEDPRRPDTLSEEARADLYRQVDVITYLLG